MAHPEIISAFAALAGSSIGGLTPLLSNYVLQRSVTRRDLMNREIEQRQTLYSDFISEAARLYAEAATRSSFELSEAVGLYALVSRMRLVAPKTVIHSAEEAAKAIAARYGATNLSLEDLRAAAITSNPDPLYAFSSACRQDLFDLSTGLNRREGFHSAT